MQPRCVTKRNDSRSYSGSRLHVDRSWSSQFNQTSNTMQFTVFLIGTLCSAVAVAQHGMLDMLLGNTTHMRGLASFMDEMTAKDASTGVELNTAASSASSLGNFPLTFLSGFARQDFLDLTENEFVEARVYQIGVCAPYDPSVAFLFKPPATCPVTKAFKIESLVFLSANSARLTFRYYESATCSGSFLTSTVINLPVTGTQATSTSVVLTSRLSYIQQRSDALRLIPSTSSGFNNFFYFAEGCAAPSIYFIIGPTNRCANFITGFGITTCTATALTANNYIFASDPTCAGPSTVVFTRGLTCAPIVLNGRPISDLFKVTCVAGST